LAEFKLYLFGRPRLEQNGDPLPLERGKALALLAFLTLHRQPLARNQLASLLWPESDQSAARANLRTALAALKRVLGTNLFETGRETIALCRDSHLWIDVVEFRTILTDATGPSPAGRILRIGCSNFPQPSSSTQKIAEASLALRRALDDQRGIGCCLWEQGSIVLCAGDHQTAVLLFQECLEIANRLKDHHLWTQGLEGLGWSAFQRKEWDSARQFFKQSLAITRQAGRPMWTAFELYSIAWERWRLGKVILNWPGIILERGWNWPIGLEMWRQ
jgi:tetratricopeptide (TPR) repeat protein